MFPPAAYVLAFAPSAFSAISLGRLYGYDQRLTIAVPLLTVPVAIAFVPLVKVLGS